MIFSRKPQRARCTPLCAVSSSHNIEKEWRFIMKKFTLLLVIALLLVSVSSVWADNETYHWNGKNGLDSEKCAAAGQEGRPESGWIHWVFTDKGSSTDAVLTLSGSGSGSFSPGHPTNASAWHFYTPYYPLGGLNASVQLSGGNAGKNAKLVISDYCQGAYEQLEVTKTAVTAYTRTHNWDIAKKVDPTELYLYVLDHNGLTTGTATWTIDLTYGGYVDSDYKVSGAITIKNTGGLTAVVTSVNDVLAGSPIPVSCGGLPYSLSPGSTLTCTYSQDGYVTGINHVTVMTERDSYKASAPIVWGDPTSEVDKTVTISDVSDLLGSKSFGPVTAQNAQFTYKKDFSWGDYGRAGCGQHTYTNTASVMGSDSVVLDSASAALDVYVQCMIFRGETAWAANGNESGELRYTTQGSWATYVEYSKKTVSLFAGQTKPAGTVEFSEIVDGKVTITVKMTGDWEFEEVAENLAVQDYATAPSGNPSPGQFDYKKTCIASESTCSIIVPANAYYGVHANVGWWLPDPNFGPK
jgi:hypothetical protein